MTLRTAYTTASTHDAGLGAAVAFHGARHEDVIGESRYFRRPLQSLVHVVPRGCFADGLAPPDPPGDDGIPRLVPGGRSLRPFPGGRITTGSHTDTDAYTVLAPFGALEAVSSIRANETSDGAFDAERFARGLLGVVHWARTEWLPSTAENETVAVCLTLLHRRGERVATRDGDEREGEEEERGEREEGGERETTASESDGSPTEASDDVLGEHTSAAGTPTAVHRFRYEHVDPFPVETAVDASASVDDTLAALRPLFDRTFAAAGFDTAPVLRADGVDPEAALSAFGR